MENLNPNKFEEFKSAYKRIYELYDNIDDQDVMLEDLSLEIKSYIKKKYPELADKVQFDPYLSDTLFRCDSELDLIEVLIYENDIDPQDLIKLSNNDIIKNYYDGKNKGTNL